jgi:hypothetical protein
VIFSTRKIICRCLLRIDTLGLVGGGRRRRMPMDRFVKVLVSGAIVIYAVARFIRNLEE